VAPAARPVRPAIGENKTYNSAEFGKSKHMRNATLPPVVPQLQTPRLVLRVLDPGDADDIFAYAADPEVAQYT
jgi:RimJ/RimL family protein N-acetyltransferase